MNEILRFKIQIQKETLMIQDSINNHVRMPSCVTTEKNSTYSKNSTNWKQNTLS